MKIKIYNWLFKFLFPLKWRQMQELAGHALQLARVNIVLVKEIHTARYIVHTCTEDQARWN